MGQKQILLLILAKIVVIFAVIYGIHLYDSNAIESNRENIIHDLQTIASFSHQYYGKSKTQNGGGNNFTGFEIPSNLVNNLNGTYTMIYAREERALFEGIGRQVAESGMGCNESGLKIKYQISVTPGNAVINKIH
ncbi:MAG: hypothetical protein CVV23_16965 [Ignavibacteriae bacterium HGW-Ignavibacteriae-2]|jgi:hypothetical protein|nr:MAG: hypothetical protein CVV23_16965 [Ignavibacteriae bacterium HGW-Ignavibacteriae-2]